MDKYIYNNVVLAARDPSDHAIGLEFVESVLIRDPFLSMPHQTDSRKLSSLFQLDLKGIKQLQNWGTFHGICQGQLI